MFAIDFDTDDVVNSPNVYFWHFEVNFVRHQLPLMVGM